MTYAALDNATARIATLLRSKDVEVGDRVGVMLPNVPHFPIVFYGAQRAGAVVVPMNVLLKGREVGFYLDDSSAKVLFAWSGFAEAAEQGAATAGADSVLVDPETFRAMLGEAEPADDVVERGGDDTAVILYTSGRTGTPKGAEPAPTYGGSSRRSKCRDHAKGTLRADGPECSDHGIGAVRARVARGRRGRAVELHEERAPTG